MGCGIDDKSKPIQPPQQKGLTAGGGERNKPGKEKNTGLKKRFLPVNSVLMPDRMPVPFMSIEHQGDCAAEKCGYENSPPFIPIPGVRHVVMDPGFQFLGLNESKNKQEPGKCCENGDHRRHGSIIGEGMAGDGNWGPLRHSTGRGWNRVKVDGGIASC